MRKQTIILLLNMARGVYEDDIFKIHSDSTEGRVEPCRTVGDLVLTSAFNGAHGVMVEFARNAGTFLDSEGVGCLGPCHPFGDTNSRGSIG